MKTIVQDADTLDILRVLPRRDHFDARRLSWYGDHRISQDLTRQLVEEVHAVIRVTEEPCLKRELEESGALYFQLMHMVVQVHRDSSGLGLLYKLLTDLAGQT